MDISHHHTYEPSSARTSVPLASRVQLSSYSATSFAEPSIAVGRCQPKARQEFPSIDSSDDEASSKPSRAKGKAQAAELRKTAGGGAEKARASSKPKSATQNSAHSSRQMCSSIKADVQSARQVLQKGTTVYVPCHVFPTHRRTPEGFWVGKIETNKPTGQPEYVKVSYRVTWLCSHHSMIVSNCPSNLTRRSSVKGKQHLPAHHCRS